MKFGEKELQVIDIAEKLFAEKGYEGTSVRDIAKEAGGNVSLVSYYFGSKENLLLAVFERRADDIKSHIGHLLDNNELTDLQKVNIFIDEFMANLVNYSNLYKLLIRVELLDKDSKVSEMMATFKKKNLGMIEQILQHGMETGEFNKEANTMMLMATLVGTTMQMLIKKDLCIAEPTTTSLSELTIDKDVLKKLSTYLKGIFKGVLTGK